MSLAILESETARTLSAPQLDHRIVAGERLELVRRRLERKPGELGDLLGEILGETRRGIQPRPHGRPALRELVEARQHRLDAGDSALDLPGIAGEFLAQRQRSRVLEMGSPGLYDRVPGFGLRLQLAVDLVERGQQPLVDRARGGDVHRGREAVVRRLRLVDMVVGVDRRLAAAIAGQDLVGAARDHLVGVHVRLGARSGLPDDERKLVVVHAARDLARRLLDRLAQLGVERALAGIDPGRRLLDEAQRVDDLGRHLLACSEREIEDRALGLGAPIGVSRHLDRAEAVAFRARAAAAHSPFPSC
jgi:hypothetical protein